MAAARFSRLLAQGRPLRAARSLSANLRRQRWPPQTGHHRTGFVGRRRSCRCRSMWLALQSLPAVRFLALRGLLSFSPPFLAVVFARSLAHSSLLEVDCRFDFVEARKAFVRRRFLWDARVGLVGTRSAMGVQARSSRSWSLRRASAVLAGKLRCAWALMTTTPWALMRLSGHFNSLALASSGSEDAATSKRRWAALDTLLTFCPPAP